MDSKFDFPWLCVESSNTSSCFGFEVIRSRAQFITLGRVANSRAFGAGSAFTSAGRYIGYRGSAGWPRFPPRVCAVLDNLVLPGLLTKAAAIFFYYGPLLESQESVSLSVFRERVIASIENYQGHAEPQLRRVLATSNSFREIIEGVHWWQYHGGVRDPDGHPEDSEEYGP